MRPPPLAGTGPPDPPEVGERVRGVWARRLVAGTLALGLIAGGVGTAAFTVSGADESAAVTAPGPGPRKLTEDEAYRLSVTRFQNFRTKGVHVRAAIPVAAGTVLVDGDVDYRRKLGFAKVTGTGAGDGAGLYQWTASKVVTWTAKGRATTRPGKLPDRPSIERPLQPAKYPVDAVLVMLLQLGADHRDDVAPIRRNSTYFRTASVGAVPVDVIRGARRADGRVLTYWIDRTGRLQRVTTRVAAGPAVTTMDLQARMFRAFPRAAELRRVKR